MAAIMYATITIFYVSLLGILLMIFLKRREVLSGKPSLMSKIGAGTDHVFAAIFASIKKGASYMNRKTFVAFMHWLAFYVLKAARSVYVEAKFRFISNPQGKKLIDAVRGRGEISDHGASFFLRRIADETPRR